MFFFPSSPPSPALFLQGVVPATVAVKDGVFRVGLEVDEMEDLSRSGGEGRAIKCSTRDLPLVASYDHDPGRTSDDIARWGGKHANGS